MTETSNSPAQPIGDAMPDWQPASHPGGAEMRGKLCRLEALNIDRHCADLFAAFCLDREQRNWTYLPYGPFASEDELCAWMQDSCLGDDPCFYAVIDLAAEKAVGVASYLRIAKASGVIEVGHIHFSPLIQGRPIATEVMFLMMRQVFEVCGYRRYEWKCDALNQPSRRAALRLGFMFEGIFRQATIYKRRNRDTAWYSILDREWPLARAEFEAWLSPANFDAHGRQKTSLSRQMQQALAPLR